MPNAKDKIILKVQSEIARHDRPENRLNYQRFFKEKLKDPEGIRTAVLRSISNQCFKDVRDLPVDDILAICDRMLASQVRYMRFFAFEWALKLRSKYTRAHFRRFEGWLKRYVNNWGTCDHLCAGALGHLILQYPDLVGRTRAWAKSRNLWVRRGAAVSLIVPVRKGILLDEVFKTADRLLVDKEDLVRKGYGWMLKEAGNTFEKEVFAYVMQNKDRMPRTALRYAIEKMPPGRRRKAMATRQSSKGA
ncbi:MAG: DNA alkylation repair protein [Candidatus Zixiibacteriota bacterium]|nr:MAG: DNA alkylation repair protein [candidate division Zixibacteria bacterium]